jgi:thioesterase DpgC
MSDVLAAAGLSESDAARWAAAGEIERSAFHAEASATCEYLAEGERLLERLPPRPRRGEREAAAAGAIADALEVARERFLRRHMEALYSELTADLTRPLRDEELVYEAAERYPGLTPTRAAMAGELERRLGDRHGLEVAQGLLLAHVLDSPRAGAHLINSMLRPTPEALARLDEFRAAGRVDLGTVHLKREGPAAVLELRNLRHLNAEDDTTLAASECAVDLILLDPDVEIGVLRGGTVDHPRYAGARIFGAGLNLTRLYRGRIPFLFFLTRDLGYVHKIYRGLTEPLRDPEDTTEKLWIAVAETYAIGGACQLLHVVDHVIAARGTRLYLPARKEGIIPGASNLRLPRSVGDRLARQAIMSGLEFEAGTPRGDLLCDEVVDPDEVDAAIDARVEAMTSSGLVSAAANRRALRIAQEPLEVFRRYMSTYAREQARCFVSPALVRNLEEHWSAERRSA